MTESAAPVARSTSRSTAIDKVHYLPKTNVLFLKFQKGGTYWYEGVEPEVHQQLLDAPSQGGFFQQHIQGKYKFNRARDGLLDEEQGPLKVQAGDLKPGDHLIASKRTVSSVQRDGVRLPSGKVRVTFTNGRVGEFNKRTMIGISREG